MKFHARLKRSMLVGVMGLAASVATSEARSQETIRIGEINSYKSQPVFGDAYKKGMMLAIDETNATGGINGKKLELITRDDDANPGDAVREAEELITREKVDILAGTYYSNVGLALEDYANQKKRFLLITESLSDSIVWRAGNRYTYRLDGSTYMMTSALVESAAKLKKKRWALIYPNYEFGTAAAAAFKTQLKKLQPDVEFVTEQAPPLGKVDAGSVVQAVIDSKPDAIFNALFGSDVSKLIREGNTRGLFNQNMPVFSVLAGEPEMLEPLRDEIPAGWTVDGYPWYSIDTPAHKAFVAAYQAKYGKENLRFGSVLGYSAIQSLIAALKVTGGNTDQEAMVKAFSGLKFNTPDGPMQYRAIDHQATWGMYVGKLALKDGAGVMVDFNYITGDKLLPPDDVVRKLRPAE